MTPGSDSVCLVNHNSALEVFAGQAIKQAQQVVAFGHFLWCDEQNVDWPPVMAGRPELVHHFPCFIPLL